MLESVPLSAKDQCTKSLPAFVKFITERRAPGAESVGFYNDRQGICLALLISQKAYASRVVVETTAPEEPIGLAEYGGT